MQARTKSSMPMNDQLANSQLAQVEGGSIPVGSVTVGSTLTDFCPNCAREITLTCYKVTTAYALFRCGTCGADACKRFA